MGKKKEDKVELDGEDLSHDEKALLVSMIHERKKRNLVEVGD